MAFASGSPSPLRPRNHARRRFGRQSFHQCPRSIVQARVAKLEVGEFRFRPAGRTAKELTQKAGVNAAYERSAMSVKVNTFVRARGQSAEMCIRRWANRLHLTLETAQ